MLKIIKKLRIKKYNKVAFRQNDFGRIREYNCKGGLLYLEEPKSRLWCKYIMNEYGRPAISNDSNGIEKFFIYDSNGHLIHLKCSDGFEFFKLFDSNGNCLYYENSKGTVQQAYVDEDGTYHIVKQPDRNKNKEERINGKHKMETC